MSQKLSIMKSTKNCTSNKKESMKKLKNLYNTKLFYL
jgi:hypothetical protein